MINKRFEEKFVKEGLTFDDVLLIPAESNVEPKDVKVDTWLTQKIHLNTSRSYDNISCVKLQYIMAIFAIVMQNYL